MAKVSLQKLSGISEWLAINRIRILPEQRKYTDSLMSSYVQSRHPAVTPYAAYVDGNPVGFVLLVHAETATQWIIARLLIDKDHQRKGYAYDICDQLIDIVHDKPDSEAMVATYHDDNDAARALFAKLNFVETGKEHQGKKVARLDFEFEAVEVEDDEDDEAELDEEEVLDDEDIDDEDEDFDEDDEDKEDEDKESQPITAQTPEKVYIKQNEDIEEYYLDTEDDEEDVEDEKADSK